MVIKLEIAEAQDLEQILQLQKKAFQDQALIYNDFTLPPLTQTIDELRAEAELKTIYKSVLDGQIVGSVRCSVKDNALYVEKLFVDPDFQNRGIGTNIMHEIEGRYSHLADRYELFTGEKSERNLHIYKKSGYREIRREPTSHGFNLIHMEKSNNKKETSEIKTGGTGNGAEV